MSPSQRALFSRAYAVGTDAEALAGEIARHLALCGHVDEVDVDALAAEIAPALAVYSEAAPSSYVERHLLDALVARPYAPPLPHLLGLATS